MNHSNRLICALLFLQDNTTFRHFSQMVDHGFLLCYMKEKIINFFYILCCVDNILSLTFSLCSRIQSQDFNDFHKYSCPFKCKMLIYRTGILFRRNSCSVGSCVILCQHFKRFVNLYLLNNKNTLNTIQKKKQVQD